VNLRSVEAFYSWIREVKIAEIYREFMSLKNPENSNYVKIN